MRHIICIYLPSLPIDLAFRRDKSLRDKPLVLIETSASRQTVVAVSPVAYAIGIRAGMALAVARSRCGELIVQPFDRQQVERGYESLARWVIRNYSPLTCIESPAIIAEIGGSTRLLGSIESIKSQISRRLSVFGVNASMAVAPTIGAAWAIASAGHQPISHDVAKMLAPLPVESLRIEADVAIRLHQVGIHTIGQLVRLPRSQLPARFGKQLLHRLDQALGLIAEPIVPLLQEEPICAGVESEEPVTSIEAIWHVLGELTDQIAHELSRRNQGARKLLVVLRPAYASPIEKRLTLSRPSRQVKDLYRLLCLALENIESREGFIAIRLEVLRAQKINQSQRDFIGDEQADRKLELEDLADGLQARLGREAVLCSQMIESYIPERACEWTPWSGEMPSTGAIITSPRPLRLGQPEQIGVVVSPSEDSEGHPISFRRRGESHRISVCVGPERISGQWWDGHNKTRDYFDIETTFGERFWVFRVVETRKWYLHGCF